MDPSQILLLSPPSAPTLFHFYADFSLNTADLAFPWCPPALSVGQPPRLLAFPAGPIVIVATTAAAVKSSERASCWSSTCPIWLSCSSFQIKTSSSCLISSNSVLYSNRTAVGGPFFIPCSSVFTLGVGRSWGNCFLFCVWYLFQLSQLLGSFYTHPTKYIQEFQ